MNCQVIEIMGEARTIEGAVLDAVHNAEESGRKVHGVDIIGFTARIDHQAQLIYYRANVKVTFEDE